MKGGNGKEIIEEKARLGQNSATFAAGNSKNINACLALKSKDKYDVYERE